MVSSSLCLKSSFERLRAGALSLLACALMLCVSLLSAPLWAQGKGPLIEFSSYEVIASEAGYHVNAAVSMQPNPRLEELANVGVVLPFVLEFTVSRPRWYWFDPVVVERVLEYRLSYHALTRQYRLAIGGLQRSFPSFAEAMAAMLAVRNWSVLERGRLQAGESYDAALRFRLNLVQLPKPFQVAALGNRELELSTGWARWSFLVGPR